MQFEVDRRNKEFVITASIKDVIDEIVSVYNPEEVFEESQLETWALENGWIKQEDEDEENQKE